VGSGIPQRRLLPALRFKSIGSLAEGSDRRYRIMDLSESLRWPPPITAASQPMPA
jgi:hypothetical protein